MSNTKSTKIVIILVCVFLLFLIPVSVAGAIINNPIGFIGELIFDNGDTKNISNEISELYKEFLNSDIGNKTLDYINKKNEKQEKIYNNSYYIIPCLLVFEQNNYQEGMTFEQLNINKLIDKLFKLRYQNETDDNYILEIKKDNSFKNLNKLSNTTLLSYINHINGNDSDNNIDFIEDDKGNKKGVEIANKALTRLGCPYKWVAVGPDEFDCSGLVIWTHKQCGINLTGRPTTKTMLNMGTFVDSKNLSIGEIILFSDNGKETGIHHVGIYIGENKMIHAPHTGDVVKIISLDSKYYEREIYCYRRLY